jgi:hypothetical protein
MLTDFIGPGPADGCTVIMVDRPASSFCYARDGIVRVASGAVERGLAPALLCHEVGHLWWGIGTRFASGSEWLAEALAEHALHVAARRGHLRSYPRASLEQLAGLPAAVRDAGLVELARGGDRLAAHALRVKGGYVLAMLELVVGERAFRRALHTFHELGRTHELDVFSFFAVVSERHGHSLNWFVNQWVEGPARIELAVDARATPSVHGWDVEVVVRCDSVAVPGVPVDVLIETEGGRTARLTVDVDAVPARAVVRVDGRPTRAEVDPQHRLYRNTHGSDTEVRHAVA